MEFSTPLPLGAGNDKTLRMYTFFDAGNVFCADRTASMTDAQWKAQNRIRASAIRN